MKIPPPYTELLMECPESGRRCYSDTPDLMLGHLTHFHQWTPNQSDAAIEQWMDDFAQDENGNPLVECDAHGPYPAARGECPGCAASDRRIDRANERRQS